MRGVAEHRPQQQHHRRVVTFQSLDQFTREGSPQLVGLRTDHDDQIPLWKTHLLKADVGPLDPGAIGGAAQDRAGHLEVEVAFVINGLKLGRRVVLHQV